MDETDPIITETDVDLQGFRPMNPDLKSILAKTANTIRGLTMDATQKANSGHPGLPMGCAEIGAYLYGVVLKHNPKNPDWINRDRFILSGGHGSMLLYSCIYLSGLDLTIEEIKNFRQLGSMTPGHPEETTIGVETTTGPLGQGVGNAVGQALGQKILASRFNTENNKIIDNKVYVLMTDGDMMEGAASEASALAGHFVLDNLVVIYDANRISLDGPLNESSSEDTAARYRAYGWEVFEVDGNDLDALHETFEKVKKEQERPVLIIATTTIGKGSPHKEGSHKAHGSPLGAQEVLETKQALDLPEEPFYVPQAVLDFFQERVKKGIEQEERWKIDFEIWQNENSSLADEFEIWNNLAIPEDLESRLWDLEIDSPIAGRKASHACLQYLAKKLPFLYGGSADLSCSDMTFLDGLGVIGPKNYMGRNIKFGVREFGMATIATGLEHTKMILPFIGTFLTFSDYMRNAIRLASLMKSRVIYHFTHDSIFLGEDGPTHQPVEHLAALRAIPNLQVIRPADANEVKMAWVAALNFKGSTALILSRQNLRELDETKISYREGVGRGAYIIRNEMESADYLIVATGSEVALALDVAEELEKRGKGVRVVSMPCFKLFEKQNKEYKDSVFGKNFDKRVSIEAGVEFGWHKYIGSDGIAISVDTFGASAPAKALAFEFGFTVDSVLDTILN